MPVLRSSVLGAALVCAAGLAELPLPNPMPAVQWHQERPEPWQCFYLQDYGKPLAGAYSVTRTADGRIQIGLACYGLTKGGNPIEVWSAADDWLTLVHEGCHALHRANGLAETVEEERLCHRVETQALECEGAFPAIRNPLPAP